MNTLHVSTDDGDVEIDADDLPFISEDALARLRLSREELSRLFAEGLRLMRSRRPADRVRPVASETLDGQWVVVLVRYSPLNDPCCKAAAQDQHKILAARKRAAAPKKKPRAIAGRGQVHLR